MSTTPANVKQNETFTLLAFRKPTLKELKVGGTFGHKITDRGVSSLCAEGGSRIESLVMERCAVTDPSLHTLATEMRMLTFLDVTECGDITSDGLKIFESLVETRPSPYNHCQILR